MFEYMNLITLRAAFVCERGGRLPGYQGSTVRGILGHCFREFVCNLPDKKCFCCREREDCLYVKNFSNTGGAAGAVNPYAIHTFTSGKTDWKEGDEFRFDITLFGRAAMQAGIYLDAILAMEKKGWGAMRLPFRLKFVADPNTGKLIYGGKRLWLRNLEPKPMQIEERKADTVLVTFDTPVRIVSGNQLFQELPFPVFIRFLSRRLSLLSKAYTEYSLEWEEDKMQKEAKKVRVMEEKWCDVDFSRYSMNQPENKLSLPAKSGFVFYEGDLAKFTPLLEAGTYFHVGKNATIGFGHYETAYDGGIRK